MVLDDFLDDEGQEFLREFRVQIGPFRKVFKPSDPAREATQIARLEDLANRADLDPEFAKKFLNFIIAEVIQHHKKHQA